MHIFVHTEFTVILIYLNPAKYRGTLLFSYSDGTQCAYSTKGRIRQNLGIEITIGRTVEKLISRFF
jgi:hypothetical protein